MSFLGALERSFRLCHNAFKTLIGLAISSVALCDAALAAGRASEAK